MEALPKGAMPVVSAQRGGFYDTSLHNIPYGIEVKAYFAIQLCFSSAFPKIERKMWDFETCLFSKDSSHLDFSLLKSMFLETSLDNGKPLRIIRPLTET
jgi:hypothetical protein